MKPQQQLSGSLNETPRNRRYCKPESVARLLVGNHFRQWARVPTCGNRSVFGVGNYSFSRGALGACGAPSMKRLSV